MLFEIQHEETEFCVSFFVAVMSHSKGYHKKGKALCCKLEKSQSLTLLEHYYSIHNNSGVVSYSLGFMREFGLIGQVISEYPDQDHDFENRFVHLNNLVFLFQKTNFNYGINNTHDE